MDLRELAVPDSYVLTPVQHADERGLFLEWYHSEAFTEKVGRRLDMRQANLSVSHRGVLRGIHFADVPRGQAKLVTVAAGAVLDFVVDIRVGSPTFGRWDSVLLDDVDRRAVYLAEGLGHAFLALTDTATVTYLVSDTYRPEREHALSPLDPRIGLEFPAEIGSPLVSAKDAGAPTLDEAAEQGLLPRWDDVTRFYDTLE